MSRPRIGGLRTRLWAVVAVAAVLALAAIVVIFNLVLSGRLSADAQSILRSRASGVVAGLRVVDGRLKVTESPDDAAVDTQVWVFAGTRPLEHPHATEAVSRAALSLAGGPKRTIELASTETKLFAVPVERRGVRLGTVVASLSLKPYDRTREIALVASLILCVAVLAGVLLLARWVIARALQPVAHMTAQAADWSEHDVEGRFELGPPRDELTQLAATLDALLGRLSASLRHEQRFSAELSHELRTPLAKIRAEAEIALRRKRTPTAYRDALTAVLRAAERMSAVVETLLVAARAESAPHRPLSDVVEAAEQAVEACRTVARERNVALRMLAPTGRVEAIADGELVERILFPLVENGCRYARSEVKVTVAPAQGRVFVRVEDDGPGVARDERLRIFEPGERGQAAEGGPQGSGLGLALARRLARQAGGEIEVEPGDEGGRFAVELPRAERDS